jgi:hypothetical protein
MLAATHIVDLPPDGDVPAYEIFRQRIQNEFRQDGSSVK